MVAPLLSGSVILASIHTGVVGAGRDVGAGAENASDTGHAVAALGGDQGVLVDDLEAHVVTGGHVVTVESADDLPPLHGGILLVRVALLPPLLCTSRLTAPKGRFTILM